MVTVTSDRVKNHPRDEFFFDKFHIFHSVTGIFGKNHGNQSCSTAKDGHLYQISSFLVEVRGHNTLEREESTIWWKKQMVLSSLSVVSSLFLVLYG